jgi:putative ABC transport system permease protein
MWRITAKGVVAHRVRYALTALAVLIGVAFIAGTLVLSDTINATFNGLYDQIYQGTGAVVRAKQPFNPGTNFTNQRDRIDASLGVAIRRVPGVAAVAPDIEGYAQLVGKDGKAIGKSSNGPPTLGVAWTDVAALNPMRLLAGGRPPATTTQVVIDKHSADVGHFRVGDKVEILSQLPPSAYTITGVATWGGADSPLGATIAAFEPGTAARVLGVPGKVNAINVQAAPGVSQAELVHRIQGVVHDPKIEVVTGAAVTLEAQNAVHQMLSFVSAFLLIFAFIALFVGSFIIFNTFSIIVAQRKRELALLRAVGASRRQIVLSVLGESLVVGALASAVGVVVGVGLAVLLKAGLSALGFDLPASGLVLETRTIVVGLVAGTAITVVAAVAPARHAARIPPVTAMQDVVATPRRVSTWRGVRGTLLTTVGAGVLAIGLYGHVGNRVAVVGVGAIALFVGVASLGPLIARPATRLIGAPLAWRHTTGRIARQNAMRNPARTASTAAALMIGVALVSLITILASSAKASVDSLVDTAMKADFVVNSGSYAGGASGLSPRLEPTLSSLPQVELASGVRSGTVQIDGKTTPILAADPAKVGELIDIGVTEGAMSAMTGKGIAVSTQVAGSRNLRLGSPVVVTFPTTGRKTFDVQVVYSARALAGDYVLPVAAAAANFPESLDLQIFVKLAPGVSAAAGRSAIEQVLAPYPTATLQDQTQFKAQQARQVDQILNLVYGLLGLAVVIALIGIANTLGLSIYERNRELGLLRAVGTTRGQLRSMVRLESLVIAMFGSLEGLVLGVVLGAVVVAALGSLGITTLAVPILNLVVVTLVAGLAGLLAAIRPSRRAARLDILRTVAAE